MTAQILWDLWDIGVKFGHFFVREISFQGEDLCLELYKFGHKPGGRNGFFIFKLRESDGAIEQGAILFHLSDGITPLCLRNGMEVIWDLGFSVSDIKEIIKRIDEIAIEKGEKIGNLRIMLVYDDKPTKKSVERAFRDKSAIMPVSAEMDINEVLDDFDHPELLAAIDLGLLKLICLKSEAEDIIAGMKHRAKQIEEMHRASRYN